MELKIKALDVEEFEAAEGNGHAYGTVSQYADNQWITRFVYISFGREIQYRENAGDNSEIRYRRFVNCSVEFSITFEDAEIGKILGKI